MFYTITAKNVFIIFYIYYFLPQKISVFNKITFFTNLRKTTKFTRKTVKTIHDIYSYIL